MKLNVIKSSRAVCFVTVFAMSAIMLLTPQKANASTLASSGTCTQNVFGQGSHLGNCVQYIQTILNGECSIRTITGYPSCFSLTPDNSFGPLTSSQVKVFQGKYVGTQDGIVGPHTWSGLCHAAKGAYFIYSSAATWAEYTAAKSAGCFPVLV